MTGTKQMYTLEEIAEMFAVKLQTVQDWVRKEYLPCYRLTRRTYRVSEEQLEEFKNRLNIYGRKRKK